jgi:hypothetical protein
MTHRRYIHLMRIRRDPAAKDGWTYASVCDAIPSATIADYRLLTERANSVSCPHCRRWMVPEPEARGARLTALPLFSTKNFREQC